MLKRLVFAVVLLPASVVLEWAFGCLAEKFEAALHDFDVEFDYE